MKKDVIFCIDDEKFVLNSLKTELKENFGENYSIELSEDPHEAIEIIRELIDDGFEIPLVISDYIMPDIKGDELLRMVHEISPKSLKIMLTGQATTEGVSNAVNWARLYRYIAKPWEGSDLSLTVSEAIKSYMQEKKLEEQNEELKKLNEGLEQKVQKRTTEISVKNRILENQKAELDVQNKSIKDSIRYASRIQKAILPPEVLPNDIMPEHFVLFKPRDIVSGDFYWIKMHAGKTYVAAADCTGHGVPGAFMSILGVVFLNEIVLLHNNLETDEILNQLRQHVKTTLGQTGKADEAKDGMDIALCAIDWDKQLVQYAGAYNPLYIFRNGELNEIKANKMPIGIYKMDQTPFARHEFKYQVGDTFYMFTDGYVDQFGGSEGRKFMLKPFKSLLASIQHKSMAEQLQILDKTISDWQGNAFDQIDDICVIGFRF